MPTTTITISWSPVPGSYGTKVEYRKETDLTWTVPTIPTNPTLATSYQITIDTETLYYIRLSTISNQCSGGFILKQVYVPSGECCPVGYTMSPDNTYCYQINEVAATPPSGGTAATAIAAPNVAYSTCGSYIYNVGYNVNGTGTSSQISPSNPFWVNGAGACVNNNTTDGPLNRAGLWISPLTSTGSIGFSTCINIPATKQYYIGIGCDNYGSIKVDGVTIVQQDEAALIAQYATTATFKVWHIYPVNLTAGPHYIEVLGTNTGSVASFGAEIYDNTAFEIASATSYSGLNLIFSTKDMIGQPIQIGSGGTGYTCPSGYSLDVCDGPPVCKQIITTSPISC